MISVAACAGDASAAAASAKTCKKTRKNLKADFTAFALLCRGVCRFARALIEPCSGGFNLPASPQRTNKDCSRIAGITLGDSPGGAAGR